MTDPSLLLRDLKDFSLDWPYGWVTKDGEYEARYLGRLEGCEMLLPHVENLVFALRRGIGSEEVQTRYPDGRKNHSGRDRGADLINKPYGYKFNGG